MASWSICGLKPCPLQGKVVVGLCCRHCLVVAISVLVFPWRVCVTQAGLCQPWARYIDEVILLKLKYWDYRTTPPYSCGTGNKRRASFMLGECLMAKWSSESWNSWEVQIGKLCHLAILYKKALSFCIERLGDSRICGPNPLLEMFILPLKTTDLLHFFQSSGSKECLSFRGSQGADDSPGPCGVDGTYFLTQAFFLTSLANTSLMEIATVSVLPGTFVIFKTTTTEFVHEHPSHL